jgi:hypothetical protein
MHIVTTGFKVPQENLAVKQTASANVGLRSRSMMHRLRGQLLPTKSDQRKRQIPRLQIRKGDVWRY